MSGIVVDTATAGVISLDGLIGSRAHTADTSGRIFIDVTLLGYLLGEVAVVDSHCSDDIVAVLLQILDDTGSKSAIISNGDVVGSDGTIGIAEVDINVLRVVVHEIDIVDVKSVDAALSGISIRRDGDEDSLRVDVLVDDAERNGETLPHRCTLGERSSYLLVLSP